MFGICMKLLGVSKESWDTQEYAWNMLNIMELAVNVGLCPESLDTQEYTWNMLNIMGSECPARPETRALGRHSEEMLGPM